MFAPPPPLSSIALWRVLAAVSVALTLQACPGGGKEETGDRFAGGGTRCAYECAYYGWNEIPVHVAVLTAATGAPTTPPAFAGCEDGDTGWPCVHASSLNEYFRDDAADVICDARGTGDTADDACIRFRHAGQAERADVEAAATAAADAACDQLIALADDAGSYATFAEWKEAITTAAANCSDPSGTIGGDWRANIYLIDQPFVEEGNTSFNAGYTVGSETYGQCMPTSFIDVDRLPNGPSLAFIDAASEHEMGHAFGLEHVCSDPPVEASGGATNIMQTTDDNCCCELAGELGGEATAYWQSDVCVECAPVDPTDGCDGAPDPWDDPECDGELDVVGTREGGFSASLPARQASGSGSQLASILSNMEEMCECNCALAGDGPDAASWAVAEQASCAPGQGRFALVPTAVRDVDQDELGAFVLAPVSMEGDTLSPWAWMSTVKLVAKGSASRVLVPTTSGAWAYSEPETSDAVDVGEAEAFSAEGVERSFADGEIGTTYRWLADEASLANGFLPPIVDLSWGCGGDAPALYASGRPEVHYRLNTNQVAGGWSQPLALSPDFTNGVLWVDMVGFGQAADVLTITEGQDAKWWFDGDVAGTPISGWVRESGEPAGVLLDLYIDELDLGAFVLMDRLITGLPVIE